MIRRWPPNDAAGGNGYGPDPKAPIRIQRRGGYPAATTARVQVASLPHRPRTPGPRPASGLRSATHAREMISMSSERWRRWFGPQPVIGAIVLAILIILLILWVSRRAA